MKQQHKILGGVLIGLLLLGAAIIKAGSGTPDPISTLSANPAEWSDWFKYKVEYGDSRKSFDKLLRKTKEQKLTQEQSIINDLCEQYARKIVAEVQRYCSNDRYNLEMHTELAKHIAHAKSNCEGRAARKLLKEAQDNGLNPAYNIMNGIQVASAAMSREIEDYSITYEWSDSPVLQWWGELETDLISSSYTASNPYLDQMRSVVRDTITSWSSIREEYRRDYDNIMLMERDYTSRPGEVLNLTLCADMHVEDLRRECDKLKQRAFVQYLGCGLTSALSLSSHADVDCLSTKRSRCEDIRSHGGPYYERCMHYTSSPHTSQYD